MPVSDRVCAFCLDRPAFHIVRKRSRISGKARLYHLCDECWKFGRPLDEHGIETLDKPARAVGKHPGLDEIEKELP